MKVTWVWHVLFLGSMGVMACGEARGETTPAAQDSPWAVVEGRTSIAPSQTPLPSSSTSDTPVAAVTPEAVSFVWPRAGAAAGSVTSSVVVKFEDGMVVRNQPAGLVNLGPEDLSAVRTTLSRYRIVDIVPVFARSPAELAEERRQAESRTASAQPDLSLFFTVRLASPSSGNMLAGELKTLAGVENAYVAPQPAPPPAR